MTETSTELLYLAIYIISSMFAFLSQRIVCNDSLENNSIRFNKGFFLLSFLCAWFFVSFTKIGVDYANYYRIINGFNWSNVFRLSYRNEVEYGTRLLIIFLKTICKENVDLAIFLWKTITIVIVYVSIYKNKNRIKIGLAVSSYLVLFYLASYFLLSICLAGALFSLAIYHLLNYSDESFAYSKKKELLLTIIYCAASAFIHNICILAVPIIIVCIYINNHPAMSKLVEIAIVIAFVLITFFSSAIFNRLITIIPGFSYYSGYASRTQTGTGLLAIVRILLLMYPSFAILKNCNRSFKSKYTFILSLASSLFFLLGYRFSAIGRFEYILMPLYIMLFPGCLLDLQLRGNRKKGVYTIYQITYFMFLALRAYLVFGEFVNDRTGMAMWIFFNPFTS